MHTGPHAYWARWLIISQRAFARLRLMAALIIAPLIMLSACGTKTSEPPALDGPPNPLLYEIVSADGELEGWLLGTIHALPDGVEWRTPRIETVVEEADTLFVEIADQHNAAANAEAFRSLAVSPGQEPLGLRVDPELIGDLDTVLARSDYRPDQFKTIESWAAAIMLSRVDAKGKPANGVDRALVADFSGRPIVGFETTASQLGIFDQLPAAEQTDLLNGTLREWRDSRGDPQWLLKAWLSGNEARIAEATRSGILADPELRAALLVDRNARWMEAITPALTRPERPLIAVGTAHLVGEDGLCAMLRELGYTVTRIERTRS